MIKAEKQIEILKDVLKHIKAGRIIGDTDNVLAIPANCTFNPDLKKYLKNVSKEKKICKVCQRGALLFASVWKDNNLVIQEDEYYQNIFNNSFNIINNITGKIGFNRIKYLNNLFSVKQQMLMERAFEGNYHGNKLNEEQLSKCDTFYSLYPNSTERIVAIVKNAIKNNGTFKP